MSNGNGKSPIRVYYCANSVHSKKLPTAAAGLDVDGQLILEAVPCSGKIDPRYILKAFEGGAKAVCVLTCPNGECKRMEGNLRVAPKTRLVRQMLAEAGLNPEAVQMYLPESADKDTLEEAIATITRSLNGLRPANEMVA